MTGLCVWPVAAGSNISGEILRLFIGPSPSAEWNCNLLSGATAAKGEDATMVSLEGGLFRDDMVAEGRGNVDMAGDGRGAGRKTDDVRWAGG